MQMNISNTCMYWLHSFDGRFYVDHARLLMPIHMDKNYNRTFVVSSIVFQQMIFSKSSVGWKNQHQIHAKIEMIRNSSSSSKLHT